MGVTKSELLTTLHMPGVRPSFISRSLQSLEVMQVQRAAFLEQAVNMVPVAEAFAFRPVRVSHWCRKSQCGAWLSWGPLIVCAGDFKRGWACKGGSPSVEVCGVTKWLTNVSTAFMKRSSSHGRDNAEKLSANIRMMAQALETYPSYETLQPLARMLLTRKEEVSLSSSLVYPSSLVLTTGE